MVNSVAYLTSPDLSQSSAEGKAGTMTLEVTLADDRSWSPSRRVTTCQEPSRSRRAPGQSTLSMIHYVFERMRVRMLHAFETSVSDALVRA